MSANHNTRYIDVLHYRHDGIVVTNRYFSTRLASYKVDELTDLARIPGRTHPGVRLGLAAAGTAFVAAVAFALPFTTVALTIGAPLVLAACAFSAYCARRWPAQFELIARHRGHGITLFATTDEHQFGQVTRALLRAMESADGGDQDGK